MFRVALVTFMFLAASANAQEIHTIAGTGIGGYSGDGGPALQAQISNSYGIAYDGAGNLYIADNANYVIRKVDAVTGVITTVAGNGTQGFSGDGGPATDAQFGSPVGIAVTAEGDILIADQSNHRIRRVDGQFGVIFTVAGTGAIGFSGDNGAATLAKINTPQGVAVDLDGNVYIADTSNFRIRRVDADDGIITTIAGTGFPTSMGDGGPAISATLTSPRRIKCDSLGNLYICDNASNGRIRRIDAVTGIITSVAGGGPTPATASGGTATNLNFGLPHDVAVDDTGVFYFSTGSFSFPQTFLWKVEGGVATVVAGTGVGCPVGVCGTGPEGGDPLATDLPVVHGLTLTATGLLVFSDSDRIRRITEPVIVDDLDVNTIVGTGAPGYTGNGGPAGSAQINEPQGIGYDDNGNLYFADNQNFVIRKVEAQTGIITTVAGNGTQGYSGDNGPATLASLGFPVGIALGIPIFNGNQYLLVADQTNHRVRGVSPWEGHMFNLAGTGEPGFSGDGQSSFSAQVNAPQDVAVDLDDNLIYIADTGNHRVRRIRVVQNNQITTYAGSGSSFSHGNGALATEAGLASPQRITLDDEGNLYILDAAPESMGGPRIRRIDAASGVITRIAGGGSTTADSGVSLEMNLGPLTDVICGDDGELYFTSETRVWKYKNGMCAVIAGTGAPGYSGDGGNALLADFNNISGLALTSTQQVVISDRSNHRIRKLHPPVRYGPGDVTHDGQVNIDDLVEVITHWGPCPAPCAADVNSDGTVNIDDLVLVITNWG